MIVDVIDIASEVLMTVVMTFVTALSTLPLLSDPPQVIPVHNIQLGFNFNTKTQTYVSLHN